MTEIIRNRTLRPSTRLEKSKSYKIDTKNVSHKDILVVNINHESLPFQKIFRFTGSDVAHKKSISFQIKEVGDLIDISWNGASPIEEFKFKNGTPSTTQNSLDKKVSNIGASRKVSSNHKTSFDPISDSDTTILILGTMPGDKSLQLGEYYGHSKNKFWKIISTITKQEFPTTYSDKKDLILKSRIGIWDVAHKANRKGSLDSAIEDEEPNDLNLFISRHSNLKVIGFNGLKSEAFYDKYFERKNDLKYISLPSTSPANTRINFDRLSTKWEQIFNTE